MSRSAWFCPACQVHHAPHCDTCPKPVDAVGAKTLPGASVWPIKVQPLAPYVPSPTSAPWEPYFPTTAGIDGRARYGTVLTAGFAGAVQ